MRNGSSYTTTVVVLAVLLLALIAETTSSSFNDQKQLPQGHGHGHGHKHGHKPRYRHHHHWKYPEPDRKRPQKKFRGGRVRHPMFEGSGCPASSVQLVNSTDSTSFVVSALFSQFQAQTSGEQTRDRKTCIITIVLQPEENMSIGVSHVDFRGNAYVPDSLSSSPPNSKTFASLDASYRLGAMPRQLIAKREYASGYDDDFYEALDVDPIAWTPCENPRNRLRSKERVFEFRISAKITASKRTAEDDDVAIAVDSSDATLQKGLYYELTTRPCGGQAVTVPPPSPPSPPSPTPAMTTAVPSPIQSDITTSPPASRSSEANPVMTPSAAGSAADGSGIGMADF